MNEAMSMDAPLAVLREIHEGDRVTVEVVSSDERHTALVTGEVWAESGPVARAYYVGSVYIGSVYVRTDSGDNVSSRVRSLRIEPRPLPTTVGTIIEDAEGHVWLLTTRGWREWDPSDPFVDDAIEDPDEAAREIGHFTVLREG